MGPRRRGFNKRAGLKSYRAGRATFRKGYDRTSGRYGNFSSGLELKFYDQEIPGSFETGGELDAVLLSIAQGTGESQRIGRKITLKSIGWKFEMTLPSTTLIAQTSASVRLIFVLDKQCNGTAPSVAQVLEDSSYQSFNNLSNKSRFRTLMDRNYTIESPAIVDGVSSVPGKIQDSFYKKCNIPIEYDGVTGGLTEIRSNNLFVLLLGAGVQTVTMTSRMRIRYSDM